MSVWKLDEKLLIFASIISPSKIICLRSSKDYVTPTLCMLGVGVVARGLTATEPPFSLLLCHLEHTSHHQQN